MTATYTQEDIHRWFEPWTIEKSANYLFAVRQLRHENDQITALVQGSARRPYHVWVDLKASTRTARSPLVAECSCPVGQGCKHLAAVMAQGLDLVQVSPPMELPAAPLTLLQPPRMELLHALSRWHARHSAAGSPATSAGPARGICYDLSVFQHRLVVYVQRTKRAADGSVKREKVLSLAPDLFVAPAGYLTQDDIAVLAQLWLLQQHHDNRDRIDIVALLQRIIATGRAFIADATAPVPAHWSQPRSGTLHWKAAEYNGRLRAMPAVRVEGGGDASVHGRSSCYMDVSTGEVGALQLAVTTEDAGAFLDLPGVFPEEAALVSQTLQQIDPALPHPAADDALPVLEAQPLVPVLRLHSVEHRPPWLRRQDPSEWRDFATATFEYGATTRHLDDPSVFVQDAAGQLNLLARDAAEEHLRERELQDAGLYRDPRPVVSLPGTGPQFLARGGDWALFLQNEAPQLQAQGWRVEPDATFRHQVTELDTITLDVQADRDVPGWFEIGLDIEVEGQTLALAPLLQQVLNTDPRWSRGAVSAIADDELVLLPSAGPRRLALRAARLKPLIALLGDLFSRRGAALRIPLHDHARLRTLQDSTAGLRLKDNATARSVAQRLLDGPAMVPAQPPAGLQATLRHYQLDGLSWLQHLRQHRLGGVLADDMGLGKTLQTLAHILLEKEAGRLRQPVLVVVPTSLLHNWQTEAARFTPKLRVLALHGPTRSESFAQIPRHDLVLTTYPLLWRDEEVLREQTWHLLVLDEAQQAKNPRSRAAMALRALKANHRLCLTGTPLENHLGELWTQFDFLLPGLLGSEKVFNQQWRYPIERNADTQRAQWLAQRMRPFMLRRRKDEVAAELPAKTLITRSVVMEGTQRDMYETVRATMEEKVREAVSAQGLARSHIVVLDALLKLRQVCCDPRLLPGTRAGATASAKLELLREMLPEMVEEGRRILLFSQFTSMLDLLGQLLDELGLAHVVLTGQTRDRQTPVQRFMQGEVPIFLISLKAGGVGLNLTRADTVIHFDPWWNPAAENQATDRAHRIGQDQPVFVYKLIAAGSIEERIAEMQERKAALAETILDGGGATGPRFSDEDLQALLAPLPGAMGRRNGG